MIPTPACAITPDDTTPDKTMNEFLASTEAMIARLHRIAVPDEPAATGSVINTIPR